MVKVFLTPGGLFGSGFAMASPPFVEDANDGKHQSQEPTGGYCYTKNKVNMRGHITLHRSLTK